MMFTFHRVNINQLYGVVLVLGGLCAMLRGLGVISPPPNISESRLSHFMWIGPLVIILGLIEFFGNR